MASGELQRGPGGATGGDRARRADGGRSCSATPWGRPASTRSTSTTTSRPASGTDRSELDSCLRALRKGRRTRRLAARPPRPEPRPTWSTPCRTSARGVGLRVLAGQGAQVDTTTAGRPPRVRQLRGAGRVRSGADPRTPRGRARGAGPEGPRGLTRNPRRRLSVGSWCAVTRRHSTAGANPARQLSLPPVAVGADDGGNDIG